jgi:hypothetical protein
MNNEIKSEYHFRFLIQMLTIHLPLEWEIHQQEVLPARTSLFLARHFEKVGFTRAIFLYLITEIS